MSDQNLQDVDEGDLIAELVRRGWTFKEIEVPIQTSPGPDDPKHVVRQLRHTRR